MHLQTMHRLPMRAVPAEGYVMNADFKYVPVSSLKRGQVIVSYPLRHSRVIDLDEGPPISRNCYNTRYWLQPTELLPEQELLLNDKKTHKHVKDIMLNKDLLYIQQHVQIGPFQKTLSGEKLTYELGYVVGAYMCIGFLHEQPVRSVIFICSPSAFRTTLLDHLVRVYQYASVNVTDRRITVNINYTQFEFLRRTDNIPELVAAWQSSTGFPQGIIDGFLQGFHSNELASLTPHAFEIVRACCMYNDHSTAQSGMLANVLKDAHPVQPYHSTSTKMIRLEDDGIMIINNLYTRGQLV